MLTLSRMSLLWVAHRLGWGVPFPKVCHTFPTMMKDFAQLCLAPIRSGKYSNPVTHLLKSTDMGIFSPEITKFCYLSKVLYVRKLHSPN